MRPTGPIADARALRPDPDARGLVLRVKWDGFREIVSSEGEPLRVRSRRGWNMTELVPELTALPVAATLRPDCVWMGRPGEMNCAGRGLCS
jgi:ATP-dependent DNA ligase